MKSVSLVMATYNGEKYLREQLDSIYSQTMVPDEVIVVDDCSTDGTVFILKEYKEKFGLQYFVNERNMGVNKNFEKAISLSSGDYICISDQDDVWKKDKIEKTFSKIKEIEENAPACVSSHAIHVDENLKPLFSRVIKFKDSRWEEPLYGNGSQGCSLMFNKKLKDKILPLSKYFIYDHFIGVISCFVGNRCTIGTPLMFYRHHGKNVVANQKNHYKRGMSEAISIHLLMKRKERLYLLKHLKEAYSNNFDEEKRMLLDKTIQFFSFKNDIQMMWHVIKCKHYPIFIKMNFVLFTLLTLFLTKRRVKEIQDPVLENKEY